MGSDLALLQSPSSLQDAGNCGLLRNPRHSGRNRKARLFPQVETFPPPLCNETSGLKKQTWSLRSLQYNFSAHPRLENFSSLNEDFFFFQSWLPTKRERRHRFCKRHTYFPESHDKKAVPQVLAHKPSDTELASETDPPTSRVPQNPGQLSETRQNTQPASHLQASGLQPTQTHK